MQVKVTITDDGVEKTFVLDTEKPEDPNAAVNPILAIAKKYHLDLLGSWSRGCGEAICVPWDEHISAAGFSTLARMLAGEWGGGVPLEDFTGKIFRWVKIVQYYDFPKLPPRDLSLICGAILAVWEEATMNVSPEGRIVLGGEPDYCPLYGPACKLWRIVKEGNEMASESDIHMTEQDGQVSIKYPDGDVLTFSSWREALDYIAALDEAERGI